MICSGKFSGQQLKHGENRRLLKHFFFHKTCFHFGGSAFLKGGTDWGTTRENCFSFRESVEKQLTLPECFFNRTQGKLFNWWAKVGPCSPKVEWKWDHRLDWSLNCPEPNTYAKPVVLPLRTNDSGWKYTRVAAHCSCTRSTPDKY